MDLPQDKYQAQQFYEIIQLLHLSEQTLLLEQDPLNHQQVRKPPVQMFSKVNLLFTPNVVAISNKISSP